MIIVELVDNDTRERRYSDKQVKLLQKETGNLYDDAVDVIPCRYTYEETDEPITPEPNMISGIPEMMIPPLSIPNNDNNDNNEEE